MFLRYHSAVFAFLPEVLSYAFVALRVAPGVFRATMCFVVGEVVFSAHLGID